MLVTSTQGHRGGDAMDKWDSVMADSSIDPNRIALCLSVPVSSWQKAEGIGMIAVHWCGEWYLQASSRIPTRLLASSLGNNCKFPV